MHFCFLWWRWAPNITNDLNGTLCCCGSGIIAYAVTIWPAARLGTMMVMTMKNMCWRRRRSRCQSPNTAESSHRPRRFGRIAIGLRRLERHGQFLARCRGGVDYHGCSVVCVLRLRRIHQMYMGISMKGQIWARQNWFRGWGFLSKWRKNYLTLAIRLTKFSWCYPYKP